MNRIVLVLMAAAFVTCAQADPTLTLLPTSGAVGGLPGTTVGWGFTLTDTSTSNWIVLNDSYFVGSPVYGTYTDYVSLAFDVAGPAPESPTVSQAWNQALQLGVGAFLIYATDPGGIVIPGTINVDYSVFSQDPNNPNFDPNSFLTAGTFSDPVQILVTPEPASWILLTGAGLVAAMLPNWRRKLVRR
jgi:hypothetical protein